MNDQTNSGTNSGENRLLSEEEVAKMLNELDTPEIPTEVTERISHAIAAEAPFRTTTAATATQDSTGADTSNTSETPAGGNAAAAANEPMSEPVSLDAERTERSRRQTVLGAIAGIAAVGVLGVIGFQVVNSPNNNDLNASRATANNDRQAAQPNQLAYPKTPVIVSGTVFNQSTLKAQVEHQLPKWKQAQARVEASPEAVRDVNLDGRIDGAGDQSSPHAIAASQLRQRLGDCLSNLQRDTVTPLVVDLAQLRTRANVNLQPVAVVALPYPTDSVQNAPEYQVYFMSPNCSRENTPVLAQVTVPNN